MLRRHFSLCLALVVGTLTLANGLWNSARIVTIVYRVAISGVIFGIVGYGLGIMFENLLKDILLKQTIQRQQVNTDSEQQTNEAKPTDNGFSPFTSENFEQISRPK